MKNLISVIIPVYNVENYLEMAVNSVINQTYTNLEIILIDDGSTDNSGKICDEFAKKDNRVKVIHQKNSGGSEARNVGIKNATGRYIGFVDSDDVISNKMYEFMYRAIIESNVRIAACDYVAFKNSTPNFDENYKSEIISGDEAIKEILLDRKVKNFTWNKLYDIELFKNVEFIVGKKYEDLGSVFKLFLKVDSVVYLDNKLYGYRAREESITGNYEINSTRDFIEMVKYRYEYLMREKPNLSEYINMNRVNTTARYFIDIAKNKKLCVFKNKLFKKQLYNELEIAKKLNTKKIRKMNRKELNLLNQILYFNPYIFYFLIRIARILLVWKKKI